MGNDSLRVIEMKKSTCFKLTAALFMCLFFCGCQTGPTDEELINTTMNSWKQAIIAQDIDVILKKQKVKKECANSSKRPSSRACLSI